MTNAYMYYTSGVSDYYGRSEVTLTNCSGIAGNGYVYARLLIGNGSEIDYIISSSNAAYGGNGSVMFLGSQFKASGTEVWMAIEYKDNYQTGYFKNAVGSPWIAVGSRSIIAGTITGSPYVGLFNYLGGTSIASGTCSVTNFTNYFKPVSLGSMISHGIANVSGIISSALITDSKSYNTGSISYKLSANSGTNFQYAGLNSITAFTNTGSYLKSLIYILSGTECNAPYINMYGVQWREE